MQHLIYFTVNGNDANTGGAKEWFPVSDTPYGTNTTNPTHADRTLEQVRDGLLGFINANVAANNYFGSDTFWPALVEVHYKNGTKFVPIGGGNATADGTKTVGEYLLKSLDIPFTEDNLSEKLATLRYGVDYEFKMGHDAYVLFATMNHEKADAEAKLNNTHFVQIQYELDFGIYGAEGNDHTYYPSIEKALEADAKNIVVNSNVTVDNSLDIPAGTTLTITAGNKLTLGKNTLTIKTGATLVVESTASIEGAVIDEALENAQSALAAAKSALTSAKAKVSELDKENFTVTSWAALMTALAMQEATLTEIEAKTAAINVAIAALEMLPEEPTIATEASVSDDRTVVSWNLSDYTDGTYADGTNFLDEIVAANQTFGEFIAQLDADALFLALDDLKGCEGEGCATNVQVAGLTPNQFYYLYHFDHDGIVTLVGERLEADADGKLTLALDGFSGYVLTSNEIALPTGVLAPASGAAITATADAVKADLAFVGLIAMFGVLAGAAVLHKRA